MTWGPAAPARHVASCDHRPFGTSVTRNTAGLAKVGSPLKVLAAVDWIPPYM